MKKENDKSHEEGVRSFPGYLEGWKFPCIIIEGCSMVLLNYIDLLMSEILFLYIFTKVLINFNF